MQLTVDISLIMRKTFLYFSGLVCVFLIFAKPVSHPKIVKYKTIDKTELRLVIYTPETENAVFPAIMFFHGHGSDYHQFEHQAIHLCSRGMVSILVEYRDPMGGEGYEISSDDAGSAVQYVDEHAQNLKIIIDKIVLSGGSKGGYLALATGFKRIKGLIPCAYVLYNPALRFDSIPDSLPPIIILHGSNDVAILPSSIEEFKNRIIEEKGKCQVIYYEGQKHGFFNYKNEGNPYFKETLMTSDSFLTELGLIKPIDYSNESWYMGN